MNYLLDTHIFIWALFEPEKLSGRAVDILSDPEKAVYISPITFWEIAVKYALGKLEMKDIAPDELPDAAGRMHLETLALTPEDAATFHKLPKIRHKDPFDRMIIWQAIRHHMTLISRDSKFPEYRDFGLAVIS